MKLVLVVISFAKIAKIFQPANWRPFFMFIFNIYIIGVGVEYSWLNASCIKTDFSHQFPLGPWWLKLYCSLSDIRRHLWPSALPVALASATERRVVEVPAKTFACEVEVAAPSSMLGLA